MIKSSLLKSDSSPSHRQQESHLLKASLRTVSFLTASLALTTALISIPTTCVLAGDGGSGGGYTIPSDTGPNWTPGSSTTVQGGHGGKGTDDSYLILIPILGTGGSGGNGGATGNNGANGGDATYIIGLFIGGGGGGGGGSNGAIAYANLATSGNITGGSGGTGGNGVVYHFSSLPTPAGGGGGGGGAGIFTSVSNITITNSHTITGGAGGTGSSGSGGGGGGGGGGAGIFALAPNATIINANTIIGGAGDAGPAYGYAGAGGNGSGGSLGGTRFGYSTGGNGIAAFGDGAKIINSGTISGGLSGNGIGRANAIQFSGNNNYLEIWASSILGSDVANAVNSTGNTLALGGPTNASFNVSQIGGTGKYQGFDLFSKTGASLWTLTGTTTATTPWTISQGTLSISSDSNLGAAYGTTNPNATVTLGDAAGATSGTLQVTGNAQVARPVILAGPGGIIDPFGNTVTLSGGISGGGSFTLNDSAANPGTIILTGNNAPASTTLTKGTLQIGDGVTDGSMSGDITNNAALIFNQVGTGTYDGNISGTGIITKTGAGTTNLTGTNATAALNLNAGTLALDRKGTTVSGAFTAQDNTTLSLIVGSSATPLTADTASLGNNIALNISGISSPSELNRILISTENGVTGGFNAITVGGFNGVVDYMTLQVNRSLDNKTYTAAYGLAWYANNNLANGVFTLTDALDAFSVGTSLTNVAANPSTGWNGSLLTKNGLGSLTLNSANTHSGGTVLNAGTLVLGNSTAAGTGAITYGGAATLKLGASSLTIANAISLANSMANTVDLGGFSGAFSGVIGGGNTDSSFNIINSGATQQTLALTKPNTYNAGITSIGSKVTLSLSGDATISQSKPTFTDATSTFDISSTTSGYQLTDLNTTTGKITLGSKILTLVNNISTSIASIISGTGGSVVKQGTDTATLTSANTYTGMTTINAGTLALQGAGSIASSSGVTFFTAPSNPTPVIFDISGITAVSATIGDLIDLFGGATVNLGDKILTFGTERNQTFAGVIQGSGSLTKQGTGIATLTNSSTYTGWTRINAGTLALQDGGSITSSLGAMLNAAGTTFDISQIFGVGTTIGDLIGSAGSALTLGSKNLTFGTENNTVYAGTVSGSGNLQKQGSGTATLSAASPSYTGLTTISTGEIALKDAGALGANTITNNSTLSLNFSSSPFSNMINGNGITNIIGTNVGLSGDNSGFTGLWNISGSASIVAASNLGSAAVALSGVVCGKVRGTTLRDFELFSCS